MRIVWLPRVQVTVSENSAWWLKRFATRDWPIVNGTEPLRV